MPSAVIGVDCATQPRNVGLALLEITGPSPRLVEVQGGTMDPLSTVRDWGHNRRVLLALDAPLGWPSALARSLQNHAAGAPIDVEANALFRRKTDDAVHQRLGKRPLDVGADRIARTARWSLAFLQDLRETTRMALPLAWTPAESVGGVVEVYPAASLEAMGISSRGYKGTNSTRRAEILEDLGPYFEMAAHCHPTLVASDHALDALICALAGVDFVRGAAVGPRNASEVRTEGWIWVRSR